MEQPKIELNKMRDLDEVISDTILFFKQNFKALLKTYFTICGFFVAVSIVLGVINYYETLIHTEEGTSIFTLTYFVSMLFTSVSIIATSTTTLSFMAVYKEIGNETPTVADVWGYFKYYFLKVLGSGLVIFIGVIIGSFFCILPGIYLYAVLSLVAPIIVMENTTFGYALDRCFQIIKNNWWTVFGSLLVISIILFSAFAIIAAPLMLLVEVYALISGASIATIYQLPIVLLMNCAQFLYILPVITLALNYFSLTEQKDGVSLKARIERFGIRDNNTSHKPAEEY